MNQLSRSVLGGVGVLVGLSLASAAAHADKETLGVWVQGAGMMAGNSTDQIMPGSSTPSVGGFQLRAGIHLGPLEGYYDRTSYFHGASVTRAILGFYGDIPAGPVNVVFRGGAGAVWDEQGGIDGDASRPPRKGLVARAGLGIEVPIIFHFKIGACAEAEYFAVHDPTMPELLPSDVQTGPGFQGLVYLKFGLGI